MTQQELELIVRKAPKKTKRRLYAILAYDLFQKHKIKERMRIYRAKLSTKKLAKKSYLPPLLLNFTQE